MTQLGCIRHGVTDWNVAKRVQGHTDIPLNETGQRQARALADRLRNETWEVIYSSDLLRAKQTAEIIADTMGLPIKTDPRLREMHCGALEGTTAEERIAKWGDNWKQRSLGVESKAAILDRGLSFINDVLKQHAGARVLVVSHGAILRLTLRELLAATDHEEPLLNTSFTKLIFADDTWHCDLYNCTKHIE